MCTQDRTRINSFSALIDLGEAAREVILLRGGSRARWRGRGIIRGQTRIREAKYLEKYCRQLRSAGSIVCARATRGSETKRRYSRLAFARPPRERGDSGWVAQRGRSFEARELYAGWSGALTSGSLECDFELRGVEKGDQGKGERRVSLFLRDYHTLRCA